MPEEKDPTKSLLQRLSAGTPSIASSEAARNSSNYNAVESTERENAYAQEITKAKRQKDNDLKESGFTEDKITAAARASEFWTDIFNVAKTTANAIIDPFNAKEKPAEKVFTPGVAKPVEQIKDEVVTAFNANKSLDRAIKSGIVRNDDFGNKETLDQNLPLMEEDDFLDQVKYGLGIEQDKIGNKKFSLNLSPSSKYFFYLDKDEEGNDILAKRSVKDYNKFKKTGKTVLNTYGTTPFNQGFLREVGAGLSNTYSGLAENLVNVNRAGANLIAALPGSGDLINEYAKKSTAFGKDFATDLEINQTQAGVGGATEWLGAGVGQGASSIAQMAILGQITGGLGSLIAPAASNTAKFQSLVNFGAGSVLNFNEAYKSALDAGLSETKAASVGALTGAVNGLIESAIGTNRLFNWLSGGGNTAIPRVILRELGEDVTESSINRVFNDIRKGLTGDAGSFLNRVFEMPVLGEALEEGTEELLQTFSQKGVENLYDVLVAPDAKKGEGAFGSKLFSKETGKEALESAFFGALLGAGGGAFKYASEKAFKSKNTSDNSIIPMIADGQRGDIEAIVKTMHTGKMISDTQKDFYLKRIDQLDNLLKSNTGVFDNLDKQQDQDKAKGLKNQALSIINDSFRLSQRNSDLLSRLEEAKTNPDVENLQEVTEQTAKIVKNNTLNIKFLDDYVAENFTPREDGKIQAYEDNYLNEADIVDNKFKRFAINEDIKSIDNLIANSTTKIAEYESQLQAPENLESPKEVRAKLVREQLDKAEYEGQKQEATASIQELVTKYNEMTSDSFQSQLRDKLNQDQVTEAEAEAEPVVSTPVEAVEEAQVTENENTIEDQELAPINQEQSLIEERDRLQGELDNNAELDPETINSISDQITAIEDQLFEMQDFKINSQEDFDKYYEENLSRAKAVSNLDYDVSEPALTAIKKDLEATMAGFQSRGIDAGKIKSLHTSISNKLLEIRNNIKATADEQARLAQEEADAKKNDNQKLVSGISYFDRIQRTTVMNNLPDFYTDEEINLLFQNTPIGEILSNVSLEYTNPADLGYTVGQVLQTFNTTSKVIVPEIFVHVVYNGKKIGNLNQLDGLSNINLVDLNINPRQYQETVARNNKIKAILKQDGSISPALLNQLGFNLQWDGKFTVDNATPRTLIKDIPAAKLTANGGKYYIIDRSNNANIEITDGTVNMREQPNVPPIPDGLVERYVVLVQATNGKYYWVGAQNQVLSEVAQRQLYTKLMGEVAFLKNTTLDAEAVKQHVGNINRYLNDNVFVSVEFAELQFTTPNATNKKYTINLKIKGQKGKRVELDPSKYATIDDLLAALGLDKTKLRVTLPNLAPARETINKLSLNLTPDIVTNPLLYKQITIKFDDNKLNDYLIQAPIVEQTAEVPIETEDQDNPFAQPFDDSDTDPTLDLPADVVDEVVPDNKPVDFDLSIFDASFNDFNDGVKSMILKESAPLLIGFEDLSKLKKKGVETKVRAIINSYRASSDPIFSIGESEEIMDYPEAVSWIEANLPSSIGVADVNTLLGNIKNNGTTFGAFADNIIYLNSNAEVGTQYHEAFHAVYRSLLTDKQIAVANNLATKKYGKPSNNDIEKLRNSSSVFFNYTDSQLESLWLEEKMADDFKVYGLSNNTSGLNSIFNKIRNWINYVLGNMDELQSLFYNINRGKFKNANQQSNKYSRYANQDRVFSIYNKGTDEAGNTITTTQLEGQGIVASLTNKFLQGQLDIQKDRTTKLDDKSKDALLDKLIADKAKFYSIDDNPYYEEYLESTGLINDDAFLETMTKNLEQKRNVFVLPNNITALKKDILNKSKIFDLDESRDIEEAQEEIDDLGEQFERDNWTIGGETSFSAVLRTYISLVTIKTTDEYGQEVEEGVDFKKVYRGLVRALSGVEEDQVLPRFKALAEFDEDINAVFNQLLSDTGLTREGSLDIQNITKGQDIFRKFITAFNNERVGWYTILHSESQSRLVESNNASSKDLQFNEWLQNYSITHEEIGFNTGLKKSLESNLDFINRSENITVTSLAEAKQEAKAIKAAFRIASIKLSDAYLAYSLLKKSDYTTLDQEGKDFLNSFKGTEGLYDGGNIPFIISEFKSGYNPFLSTKDDKGKERGAVTRLKDIAEQNAIFDPTVGESSFQNADGKNVYSIIRPSFGLVKLRWLSDKARRTQLLADDKSKKDDFIDPLDNVTLNHLLASENIDVIMEMLNPSMIDGYRQTNITGDATTIDEGEGVTFGKFNAQQYMLADLLMFLSNRKSLNSIDENGKLTKLGESAMFNINQMEASNTGYGVFLPVNNYKTINQEVLDNLFNYLAQEAIRINKVKNEFKKEGIKTWVGYNDKPDSRGFKLMEFAGYGLDTIINDITGNDQIKEDVYNNLLGNKDEIQSLIKDKLTRDIQSYKEALIANNIFDEQGSMLPSVELIRQGFIKEKEKLTVANSDALITDYYLNAYINTLGINNLLLDNYAKKVKNTVDWFKRAKGIIGSGPDLGKGFTRVAVYDEPVAFIDPKNLDDLDIDKLVEDKRIELEADSIMTSSQINDELKAYRKGLSKGEIKVADAQSYVTLDHKILQLQRWGRFPARIEAIYNKIAEGRQITWAEKEELEHNNSALNSTKTVAYNGDHYFKLSELILTPRLVGEVYPKGHPQAGDVIMKDGRSVKAKEGFEYLFNKYNAMLDQGVDQALPLSASKMATIAPAKYVESGKFDFSQSIMELENKFKRLQVETPSGKSKITQGTQLIQLVHSEQDDNMAVDFSYNSDVKTLGDLRRMYRQLLADNRLEGFKQALAYIRDPLSGEFNSKELTKKFYNTIVESGADEVLSNFFTPDHNGERQFNWNLGPVVNKAEQLFLAHFSKGVLSQKVPGLKVSLVSDSGIKIKDKVTGKMRSLQHMVKDEDGNYYSECLLPPFANELMGKDPSDAKIKEVLKMFGVRIPTQDKHSMISLKVVGFLPVEYGSVGVFPKEIVFLSGADFDIDSEFIHRYDYYTLKDGTTVKYGSATTNEGKYEEYLKWNLVNNKMLKSKFKELNNSDEIDFDLENLSDFMNIDVNQVRKNIITKAFASLGLPSTLEEFIEQNPINIGVNNNAMLEAQIKFLTNDYVRTRAARIPASMTSIENVRQIVEDKLGLGKAEAVSPNTPLARFNANRNNMEGKQGIGPVALANVTHSLLSTNNIELFKLVDRPFISGRTATGFGGVYTIDSETDRKNDNISTLLSAMTDNAKEQHAKVLNLLFNSLPTDTLPVASYMLSLGYTMEETILFLNQPAIKIFSTGDAKLAQDYKDAENNLRKIVFAIAGTNDLQDPRYIAALNKYIKENRKEVTIQTLIDSLVINKNTDPTDTIHNDDILQIFFGLQNQAQYTQKVSALLSLNKGLKSTFDDNLKLDRVLETLQLKFLNNYISADTESYEDLMNTLEALGVIKEQDGKWVKDKNFPVFKPNNNNPNLTPFDARIALLNDPNTIQNIIIHKKVMDASKEFFLLNTNVFKSLTTMLNINSKQLVPFFMDRSNKTYLEEVYPEKYEALQLAKDNVGYMVHKSGANSIGRQLWNLKKDPQFRDNILIKLLTLKDPRSGSNLVQIEFPTRIKAEGDFYTNLNNAFKELFMNTRTRDFARKLYYYSYFKDGLQFKNKSFINTIPSWVFKDVSASLDLLNSDLKGEAFDDVSSLKEGVVPTVVDMITSFTRVNTLVENLKNVTYNDSATTKYTIQPNKITTAKVEIKGVDLVYTNLESYLKSLEDAYNSGNSQVLELYERGGGLYYAAASRVTSNQDTEYGITQTVTSRLLKSIKGFDALGNYIDFNLDQVIEHYLTWNQYPVAFEITTQDIVPIVENGLSSTVIDNKFIDNLEAMKKTLGTNTQESYVSPEMLADTTEDLALIQEQVPAPILEDNLETTDNNSTFVNPFGVIDENSEGDPSLGSEEADMQAFEDYQTTLDTSFDIEATLNDIDNQVDNFNDDEGNPIC